MYAELGGYVGYMQTPLREIQECYLSLVAELNRQAEQQRELEEKQAEMERKVRQQNNSRGNRR